MAWIQTISEVEAQGALKVVYDGLIRERGFVPNLHKALSLKPTILRPLTMLIGSIMFAPGSLSRAQREMIAVVVSKLNNCHY